jgi:hypothetical protein
MPDVGCLNRLVSTPTTGRLSVASSGFLNQDNREHLKSRLGEQNFVKEDNDRVDGYTLPRSRKRMGSVEKR